jgi:predicted phosphoribosyltransferase
LSAPRSSDPASATSAIARTDIKGQVAIIIDDGIATGATALAAITAVRTRQPKELVLAVPVAPLDTIEKLHPEVDAISVWTHPRILAQSALSTAIFASSATTR